VKERKKRKVADWVTEKSRAKIKAGYARRIKIDPYYQRQKCRPMILVSGNIRFMGVHAGVPLGGGVK